MPICAFCLANVSKVGHVSLWAKGNTLTVAYFRRAVTVKKNSPVQGPVLRFVCWVSREPFSISSREWLISPPSSQNLRMPRKMCYTENLKFWIHSKIPEVLSPHFLYVFRKRHLCKIPFSKSSHYKHSVSETESIAMLPPFNPMEGQKWFFQTPPPAPQPMRASEELVCICLFLPNPVFTSLQLSSCRTASDL